MLGSPPFGTEGSEMVGTPESICGLFAIRADELSSFELDQSFAGSSVILRQLRYFCA
jgi:hypothetical protein